MEFFAITNQNKIGRIPTIPYLTETKNVGLDMDGLTKGLNSENSEVRNAAFEQLLQLCQQSDFPEAKLLLSTQLKKTWPVEAAALQADGADDDQLIVDTLKEILFSECTKLASAKKKRPDYTHTNSEKNPEISRQLAKLLPIFSYLEDKVPDLHDQLFDEAAMLFMDDQFEAAWTIYQIYLLNITSSV